MNLQSIKRYGILAGVALAMTLLTAPAFADELRYLVQFSAGHGPGGKAALRASGARIVLELAPQNAVAARIPEAALAGLRNNPHIAVIEVDAKRYPMSWSNRPLGNGEVLPYGIQMVQADRVISAGESSRKVCIIDSGYSQQHIDLRDEAVTYSADAGSGAWDRDSCGHGTHVAGTVMATAGNGEGVIGAAPGVRVHVVKVFGNDDLEGGACSWTYSSSLVAALNACEGAGAHVISMSLGGASRSRVEEVAFDDAYQRGLLHIAAAGNDGNKRTSYPAGYASVVSVAAVDAMENVADFSQQNRDVELSAPGVAVLSTVPWLGISSLTFSDGTSISATHVANSGYTEGTAGIIVDGGLCDSVGAWAGKVVLCQRGTISFNDKVTNVALGGGVVAAIYNNAAVDPTCGDISGTLGDGNSSVIVAVGMSCADGAQAIGHLGESVSVVSHVLTPESGYESWGGTSMAAPHVSGVAALLWSCHPAATNQEIRAAMNATARDKGAAGRDPAYGYGIVQAADALTGSLGAGSCVVSTSSKY